MIRRACHRIWTLDLTGRDARTSLADARAALCIARGVDLDDIDPSTGHDLSRRAYDTARRSWRSLAREDGLTQYTRAKMRAAYDRWAQLRPDFTASDDWFADLP